MGIESDTTVRREPGSDRSAYGNSRDAASTPEPLANCFDFCM